MSTRLLTRIGWYAAGASLGFTIGLLALNGFRLNTFMFWFLLIGFTATGTARIRFWWLTRNSEPKPTEIAEVPIDYGAGTRPAAFTVAPDFGGHPDNCTRCQHQAPNISAA